MKNALIWISLLAFWAPMQPVAAREIDHDAALALKVAKVAANEGALWNLEDVKLIWQVVENNASTSEKRIEFLEKHSGRVLGVRECPSVGNCRWARNLTEDSEVLPAGIASGSADAPKNWKAYWRIEMAPRWQAVLDLSSALVRGDVTDRPCDIPPRTWGGKMDVRVALSNGLYPIGCTGTVNDGFALLSSWSFWEDESLGVRW